MWNQNKSRKLSNHKEILLHFGKDKLSTRTPADQQTVRSLARRMDVPPGCVDFDVDVYVTDREGVHE